MFYFQSDYEYQQGAVYANKKYFPQTSNELTLAKNVMQITSTEALERLRVDCPGVKCIVMLRDPAKRAYSAYHYAKLQGLETEPFDEALALEPKRLSDDVEYWQSALYLRNSTYADKIQTAYEILGRDNVLVIFNEDYKNNPRNELTKIESFIGHSLFESDQALDLKKYNSASVAKYTWLSRLTNKIFKSKSGFKRFIRKLIPHSLAVKIRHGILNFNRVEKPYKALDEKIAASIREKLQSDKEQLIKLLGHCPW
jgi:hypothetical protein